MFQLGEHWKKITNRQVMIISLSYFPDLYRYYRYQRLQGIFVQFRLIIKKMYLYETSKLTEIVYAAHWVMLKFTISLWKSCTSATTPINGVFFNLQITISFISTNSWLYNQWYFSCYWFICDSNSALRSTERCFKKMLTTGFLKQTIILLFIIFFR